VRSIRVPGGSSSESVEIWNGGEEPERRKACVTDTRGIKKKKKVKNRVRRLAEGGEDASKTLHAAI